MVARPANPIRRPIQSLQLSVPVASRSREGTALAVPILFRKSAPGITAARRRVPWRICVRDTIRLLQRGLSCSRRAVQPGVGIVMDGAERFASVHGVTDFLMHDHADRGIDCVLFFFAAAAQHQAGNTHLLALD